MKKFLKIFVYGIGAGMCISIGGTAFLSLENKVLGALFFVVGLFTICTVGLSLFTGKVCYIFRQIPAASDGKGFTDPSFKDGDRMKLFMDPSLTIDLIPIWIGNLAGCVLTAWLLSLTRIAPALTEKAQGMVDIKLADSLGSIFILAVFCNILIFIAVDGYKNNPHDLGKYLSLFLGVMVFILCGFEHCVANMFYISMAGMWGTKAFLFILVNTLGNALGGWVLPVIRALGR